MDLSQIVSEEDVKKAEAKMEKQKLREEQNWFKYEKVRLSGEYNMIMEAGEAMKDAKLNASDYRDICKRYSIIRERIMKKYTEEEIREKLDSIK